MSILWQAPWAWLGVIAIALPIAIHLLGRGHARVERFPTLRFLDPSRLLPTRRTRIHDALLLAVRVGIIAAAVAAFAQPLLRTRARTRELDAVLARAIILDTSASMSRWLDSARGEANRLAAEAGASNLIDTANPDRAIASAVAWLKRQPGRREIAIVSDFQMGTIDSAGISGIPRSIGIRFARVAGADSKGAESLSRVGASTIAAKLRADSLGTDVEWSRRPAVGSLSANVLTTDGERARADAAIAAAGVDGVRLPLDSSLASRVAIITPQLEQREHHLHSAHNPASKWMLDLIVQLRGDVGLQQSAENTPTVDRDGVNGIAVVRDAIGRPVVVAAVEPKDTTRLMLVSAADAGSLTSAMLIASTRRALSRAEPLSELEPLTIAASLLDTWQRAPAGAIENDQSLSSIDLSDGRWLWVLIVLLLGIETWLRRTRRERAIVNDEVRVRAA